MRSGAAWPAVATVLVTSALAALVMAAAGTAHARDPDLPPLTPRGEFRRVGQTDATSTEQCIGDPRTPLCAIDTFLAGFLRGRDDLCAIALGADEPPRLTSGLRFAIEYSLYRIVAAKRLRPRDIPPWTAESGRYAWKVGDIQISAIKYGCSTQHCHRDAWGPMLYTVRLKPGGRWIVADWQQAWDVRDHELPRE